MNQKRIETDFLVAGGGMSGVCAAIAAARNGAQVVLVQDRSVLGGNASSEIKMHIVGADCHGTYPGRRESGLLEELRLEDAVRNPHRSYSQWDLLLYEKVRQEKNITLLLDADLVGAEVAQDPVTGRRTIHSAKVVRNLMEDEFCIRAKFFADCTGDGRLGFEAGADFHIGRESKREYGESLAQEEADNRTLGSSILITARKYDSPQPFIAPDWVREFKSSDFKHRPIYSYEYGYWWFEWGGHLDTIKDNETIRHELLRIALGIWNYIKNSGAHPDSACWALDWVGSIPGKRESRRFLGPYVLTQNDVQGAVIFPDQVAFGGWWIDTHPPMGLDVPDQQPCVQHHMPHIYSLPLRCYHSRNVANLFFAGRNISATHIAFASTRVMGTCSVGGQAIGTAAALWKDAPSSDIAMLSTPDNISSLQQNLLKDDAYLIDISNSDPADLCRSATAIANHFIPGKDASRVLSGVSRRISKEFGPWAADDDHCWESDGLPAELIIEFNNPGAIQEIHITFDTGFARELLLSASDSATKGVIRGPQPETVKDYQLLVDQEVVANVTANHLRKRIHKLAAPLHGSRITLRVLTTNGHPNARVFEIRAYGLDQSVSSLTDTNPLSSLMAG
jgi:hypothetical protein